MDKDFNEDHVTFGMKLKGQAVIQLAGNKGMYRFTFRACTRKQFDSCMKRLGDKIYEEGDISTEKIG